MKRSKLFLVMTKVFKSLNVQYISVGQLLVSQLDWTFQMISLLIVFALNIGTFFDSYRFSKRTIQTLKHWQNVKVPNVKLIWLQYTLCLIDGWHVQATAWSRWPGHLLQGLPDWITSADSEGVRVARDWSPGGPDHPRTPHHPTASMST